MDSIIDIIILVLIGVVPAVFKAIGNKLEKAGKTDKAKKFKKVSDVFEDDKDGDTLEGWLLSKLNPEEEKTDDEPEILAPAPEVVMTPVIQRPAPEEGAPQLGAQRPVVHVKPTPRKPMMLIEEGPEKKGEKIDPRKLVVYSEIMKRKF